MNKSMMEKHQIDAQQKKNLIFLDLENNRIPIQKTSFGNIYTASALYSEAKTPLDFVEAFKYLRAAIPLRRFTHDEVSALAGIITNDVDSSPPAVAFRLNAFLIAFENGINRQGD